MGKGRLFKIGKIAVIVFMAALVILGGIREIRVIDFARLILLIRSLKVYKIVFFLLLGILSNAVMTLYDFIIIKHLKLEIKKSVIFNVSFVSNSINSLSGLGGLTGASIRAVFFKKSTKSSEDIAKYGLLLIPATGAGLSLLSLVSLIKYRSIESVLNDNQWIMLLMYAYLGYIAVYFLIDTIYYKIKKLDYHSFGHDVLAVKVKLLAVSVIEWAAAYFLFALIVRQFDAVINYFTVLGIYTAASVAGIVSMLPGGAGSFDLLILLGFKYYGVSAEHTLAALILFRTFYYFIPLAVGLIASMIAQLRRGSSSLNLSNIKSVKTFIDKSSSVTNVILMLLVFLSGALLLVSALIPGAAYRLRLASKLLSFSIMQWSHQLSVCIGVLLIIMAGKIGMKEKRAYKATFYLLIMGSVFTFLKGFNYEEAIFIMVVVGLLYMSKGSFYRKSLPFDWLKSLFNLLFILICIIVYAKLKHLIFMDYINRYRFSEIKKSTIVSHYNAIIAYFSLIVFIVLWEATKPRIENDKGFETTVDERKFNEFLSNYGGNYLTHLIYLNDKNIFWAASGRVAFIYQKSHNILVVLGDMIGDERCFREGISEFQDFADEYGYRIAFYEVSDSWLPIYHDYGYDFFKLGETAIVDLEKFDLCGPASRDFRNVMSRFERDGYVFELADHISDQLFEPLKIISDQWLKGRKEMGFSLGGFDEGYLRHSPIAMVKNIQTSEIISFASVMPSYDGNKSASIDLMRFKDDAPSNAMTYLILNLLLAYKERGFKLFNLGMAPLSNVGRAQKSHITEKAANLFMRHGSRFYSYEGLRRYKNKFNPSWEERYLAYEDITVLPSSLIESLILIYSDKYNKNLKKI